MSYTSTAIHDNYTLSLHDALPILKIPKSIRKTYRKTRTVDSEEFYTGVRKAVKKIEDLYNMLMNKKEQLGVFSLTEDRKSTRLNSSHVSISYAVFCLKKKKQNN